VLLGANRGWVRGRRDRLAQSLAARYAPPPMFESIKRFRRERADKQRFKALPDAEREIVFYAEGPQDWPHFAPIVEHLTGPLGRSLCYLTSAEDDPLLSSDNPRIRPFCIGSGSVRTILFREIQATVFVMTLPDLETYHLKRSAYPVHYAYLFHSINSTHMVYRKGAFDAYDTILCVGPHHVDEIRKTEAVYGLKPKTLLEHGYGRLDAVLEQAGSFPEPDPIARRHVLLAPSWGECSFIETALGEQLIRVLLAVGWRVTLRLHPMTVRHHPALVDDLERQFPERDDFRVVTDMKEQASLHTSHIMISDWSGASYEYAYGRGRPVLFVNTTPKINNPEYEKIALTPREFAIRDEVGDVLQPDQLDRAVEKIERLCADPGAFRERIMDSLRKWVFNVGESGKVGAEIIAGLADREGEADG